MTIYSRRGERDINCIYTYIYGGGDAETGGGEETEESGPDERKEENQLVINQLRNWKQTEGIKEREIKERSVCSISLDINTKTAEHRL